MYTSVPTNGTNMHDDVIGVNEHDVIGVNEHDVIGVNEHDVIGVNEQHACM